MLERPAQCHAARRVYTATLREKAGSGIAVGETYISIKA
jgi:hypothetical protein